MGEVWRAKDKKLGCEVSIKTLPEEFAKDADRLARFGREAKLRISDISFHPPTNELLWPFAHCESPSGGGLTDHPKQL